MQQVLKMIKTKSNSTQRKNLDEVSLIRPILIILLVLMHSFTVFNGVWPEFTGYQDCEAYKWIARSSFSFLLESFVFVSGYVWAFQYFELNKRDSLKSLLKKKLNRLLVPGLLFSIFYMEILDGGLVVNFSENGGGRFLINILSGVGHLWFLPVLFWCFLITWCIEKFNSKDCIKFTIVAFLSVAPIPALIFQLSHVPYYLVFFYSGFLIRKHIGIRSKICGWNTWILGLSFVVAFVVLANLKDYISPLVNSGGIVNKASFVTISNICKLVYSSLGTLTFYAIAVKITSRYRLSPFVISIGDLCFGVYIYQEFILRYLYYHTELPNMTSYMIVPWVGFFVALILSILFTSITKKL